MILFDTDVCLALLKGNRKLVEGYADSLEELCVSAITAQELFSAANTSTDPSGNRLLAEKFLLTVRIIHPDMTVLKYAADIQTKLLRAGKKSNYSDLLIYSLSKAHNAKLITAESSRYCFT